MWHKRSRSSRKESSREVALYQVQQKDGVQFRVESDLTVNELVAQEKNLGAGLLALWRYDTHFCKWTLVYPLSSD